MFKHVIWVHLKACLKTYVKNEKKNILILKFHPGMKCLHVFFSSPDEISSRQKRVNSKRYFTTDGDDFIPGWNFMCKHPLKNNKTMLTTRHLFKYLILNNKTIFWNAFSSLKFEKSLFCNKFYSFIFCIKIKVHTKEKDQINYFNQNHILLCANCCSTFLLLPWITFI